MEPTELITARLNTLCALLDEVAAIDVLAPLDFAAERTLLDHLHTEQERPLRVAVIGEFSTGKSTFINAVLGQDLLPARFLPTTRQVMRLCHSDGPPQVSVIVDGDMSGTDGDKDGENPVSRHLSRETVRELADSGSPLELVLPIPAPWSDLIIYDTPGVNDATSMLGTDALPVAILPKTATLTRLVHGEPDVLETVEIDREGDEGIETSAISLQEFTDLQRAAKLHDITVVQDLARIREVRVFLNDPLLDKLQLVDTPGFNHDEAMDNCTLGILDRADLVLWITDALQPAKQTEFEKLRLLKERGKRLWLIVNKADVNVADATAWEESRQSLEQYFYDIGFLDFFESRRVELISCRQTDDFWNQQFEHTKARLGTDIFNLDMWWSSNLVGDEWQRLGAALQDEDERYRELERRCEAMRKLTDVTTLVDRCLDDLNEAITPHLAALEDALLRHGHHGHQAAQLGIESVTAFAMEYTRKPLVKAFDDLTQTYKEWLSKWQVDYLRNSVALLKVIQAILPREHESLRAGVLTLRDHSSLLLERLSQRANRVRDCYLPALERTVELLDHLEVQFKSINWRFSLKIDEEGVLSPDASATSLTFPGYRRRQLRTALERDLQADLECIAREPVYLGLLEYLTSLCQGTGERLTQARQIWSNHNATGLDAD